MSNFAGVQAGAASLTSPLNAQADKVVSQARSVSHENAKIDKASKDFESILLSSWLEQAYQSFGSVPGGDSDDDLDPGKGQFQGIEMQALGGQIAASGGIGIAKMISQQLHKADDSQQPAAETAKNSGHS